MEIKYFFRHKSVGFSIQHVFGTLMTEMEKRATVDKTHMPSSRSMPWDVVRNSVYAYKHRNKKGINHISGHVHEILLGLIKQKTILTIHDLVFIDNVRNPVKRLYKWLFWLYLPIKIADKVTCISAHTKENVLRHIKTDKITVIHNPLNIRYQYAQKAFRLSKPVILHVGTGWNKNLKRTITALKDTPCHLRILGKIDEDMKTYLHKAKIEFSNVYNLSDEEVRQEYIDCDIVSFPSLYEGFGMPIIEGQATGRVVLTSRIKPLTEISGNAVQYVDPTDVNSIRMGFEKIIKDEAYREGLIRMGLKNIERFRVKEIAKQYLEIYKEVMNNG
ncbi:glycosyltransferase involved in cell wall biosynthesis [Sphingobacterium allocomposti]|uniref:Glycosyltransferase involved in cell wall biosynthesis n=1 Tax=Sphingobacterium allocomposti TaxID=415956 RepID=A0A5S5D716_9SPHI|nr:glycosyltransferase family 1 protein [Sphingobacterium composti Yoo et al. 2007 non Ten et al. 2007]TYP91078.1 glycosyltransferase involved in cell wall biosynthesis [Sphingobacterium composti Yoo et al. 2007 non Ten et al. 2007]